MVKKGFSLIEMLVVIAIVGILVGIAAIVLPKQGMEANRAAYQISSLNSVARFEAVKLNRSVRVGNVAASGAAVIVGAYVDVNTSGAFDSSDTRVRESSWVSSGDFKTPVTLTVANSTIWKPDGTPDLSTLSGSLVGSYQATAGGKNAYVCIGTLGKPTKQNTAC